MLVGFFEIEQTRIQNGAGGHLGIIGFDYADICIEAADDFADKGGGGSKIPKFLQMYLMEAP